MEYIQRFQGLQAVMARQMLCLSARIASSLKPSGVNALIEAVRINNPAKIS